MQKVEKKGGWWKLSFLPLLMLALAGIAGSCRKMPVYGDLEGQWQIMSITVDGEPQDMTERRYYCFQLHVVQITTGGVQATGNLHFSDKDRKLTMDFPKLEATEGSFLRKWGIYDNPVVFDVTRLDSGHLEMNSGAVAVKCRKF